jgi:hypothetical protein
MNKSSTVPLITLICLWCLIFVPTTVLSQDTDNEICFNFTIVTKKTSNDTETNTYKKQKESILEQLRNTQSVFDSNLERNCPYIRFTAGTIRQVTWDEALRLSQPLDQGMDESIEKYKTRKIKESFNKVQAIVNKIKEYPDIKYDSFLELEPGKTIVNAEKCLQEISGKFAMIIDDAERIKLETLQSRIQNSIRLVKEKLDSYTNEDKDMVLKRANIIFNKYEKIDQASADSWRAGVLTLWNDAEAQDTSIELKHMLRYYHANENQCLNVYVVPKGKSPAKNSKNGQIQWTVRGGAALSEKYFPRTTAGRGPAIILTQDARTLESRLAHELGHLLIDKADAHFGKESKDLMYENSLGGHYLNEDECNKISDNIASF